MRDFGIKLEANNLEELRKKLEEMEKLKRQLLEHYADRYPNRFYQYDGFVVGKDFTDDIMRPDENGDFVSGGATQELMHGATMSGY